MKTSEKGVALIKRFEGLKLEAYQDVAGVWTIGYGHTGNDVRPRMRISARDAEKLLRRDLKSREAAVNRLVSVPLSQNEFDALVSFVYNVGIDAFRRSTARRRLNSGDRQGAAEALTWWNKATVGGSKREIPGLTRRRAAEAELFLSSIDRMDASSAPVVESKPMAADGLAPGRRGKIMSPIAQSATVAGGAGAALVTADGGSDGIAVPKHDAGSDTPPTLQSEIAAAPAPSLEKFIQNHEAHIQIALLILIIVSALYILGERLAGWVRRLMA